MKTVLITGCSSGYGLETARHFHAKGWQVFATMRTPRTDLLPLSAQNFMYAVGIIEILVGLMVLTRWTRLGSWIAAAWLVLIAGNLATMGLFDIAVRDVAMAVGAYTLARLAELRQEAPAAVHAPGLRESRV